jgi:hypothetical protein
MNGAMSDNPRARLFEYAPWMARDYATNQGPATALVVLLIGIMTIVPAMRAQNGGSVRMGDVPPDIAAHMLRVMVTPLVFIGVLFATNGIVANDRKLGYYRFFFSKPVGPPSYYAMTFLVNGVGLVIVALALMGVWYLVVRPMFPVELLAAVLIMYIGYGGLGFLLSAAWRFDWLSLVTVLLLANVGWSVWGAVDGPRHWLLYLLPPVHRASDIYGVVLRDASSAMPWGSIAWMAGYGLLCFVLGMLVIRRRPLGTS